MTKDIRWKMLMATSEESEAVLLKTRLESEGIRCRLQVRKGYPGTPRGGKTREIEVFVPLEDFEASQEVVETGEIDEENGP